MELYRYRAIDGNLERLLRNHEAWFASATSFNDPFDCQLPIHFSPTEKQARAFLKSAHERSGSTKGAAKREFEEARRSGGKDWLKVWAEKVSRSLGPDTIANASLLCFSEKQSDILMFSHYGQMHRGVSIGFDFGGLVGTRKVLPVKYTDAYPLLDYLKLRDRPKDLITAMFLSKAEQWKYEQEWRFIRFEEPAGLVRFDPQFFRSVTFGCCCSAREESDVRLWCRLGGLNVQFFRARKSDTTFALEIEPA